MVEKFQTILKNIEKKHGIGTVILLALLKMDETIDKWSIVFSAPWATDKTRSETFNLIKKEIVDNLSSDEINEIARIGIFPDSEHLVQELRKYHSGYSLEDKKINGNKIHKAHIITSIPQKN